jgi:outer membrane lipoprotein SlyB
MFKKITLGAAAALTAVTALPAAANAQYYRDGYYDRYDNSRYQGRTYRDSNRGYRRCSGTTGTIIGGAGGALLGRQIGGRGDRTLGTILGGAAGALLGREIGKSTCRR